MATESETAAEDALMLIPSADIEERIAALDKEELGLLQEREAMQQQVQRGQVALGRYERELVEVRAKREELRAVIQRQEAALKEQAAKKGDGDVTADGPGAPGAP